MGVEKSSALSKTAEYNVWRCLKKRCGKTGVTICEEWGSFERFLADMGNRPYPEASLVRLDLSKGFAADNCHWANRTERENNKGNNRLLTYNGKTQSIAMWAEEIGIDYKTLWHRIVRQEWSVEKALTTPLQASS